MNIHKLLKRQLDKTELSAEDTPKNAEAWAKFLNHVNQFYLEADQDRYMQERSMQISSREVMLLNARLENAHHIAKLGSWSYDENANRTIWSKELYNLFHFDKTKAAPSFYQFLEGIHEADCYELKEKFNKALTEKKNFEQLIRVKIQDKFRWFQMIGQCNPNDRILSGIIMDIHDNKAAEEEINQLNQRLILTARQAGMSEVAASILHNIGNILNTLNVSMDILKQNPLENYLTKLIKINQILLLHQDNLSSFLKNDPKGQLIPEYIETIMKVLPEEQTKMHNELFSLDTNIQHIKDIVTSQKLISGIPNTIHEKIFLPELLTMVLKMVLISKSDQKITIEKQFEETPCIETDKSKLLQILINLVQNARDSVINTANADPKITLTITFSQKNAISIYVCDNGQGIATENLERIFSFGYTTKKEGHGFGLHSAALSAHQMGGDLRAESAGLDKGACFILTLPLKLLRGSITNSLVT